MPDKEYIEREALSQAILDLPPKMDEQGYGWLGRRGVWQMVNDFPSADVRPVVLGKWLNDFCGKGRFSKRIVQCSLCGNFLDLDGVNAGRGDANYCPNCGADMREES